MFAEALADAGVECGLPRDKAILYAAQMLKGSAELLLKEKSPASLKDKVCSPGGTTIAGVHALEDGAFRSAVMNAVTAAYKRTLELK
jgi:pyrroline-5-carboxylate reductase